MRGPGLISLSRDHHRALVAAQSLRRAEVAGEARACFLDYWETHGRRHFQLEEEILFPAFVAYGNPHDPLLARALCDHIVIRNRAAALAHDVSPARVALKELGILLDEHVRLEERELFPLIEQAMPPEQLAAMAEALDVADDD